MKQMSLGTGFEKKFKRTRKREFLDEMELVVPWRDLVALIEPHSPLKAIGRPAFAIETMLRIHLLQIRVSSAARSSEKRPCSEGWPSPHKIS